MKHCYSFLVLSLFILSLLTVFGSLSVKADDSYVIKFGYKDNEWTKNSDVGQESCAGTISKTDKIITGSDFYFSGRHDEAFKRSDDEWTGVNGASNNNAGVKACTRETVDLSAGTYTFKLLSKNTENATLTLPKIILGSDEYEVTGIIVGESSQSFLDNKYGYTAGIETTLCYVITLSSAYSGTVSVEFKDGWKEKYLFKTLTITPTCTAPNHVDISGNWDYFVGETISLSAQAYSSEGTGSPIAEGNITGYQWKYNGVDIDGATSKTYSLTTTSPSDGGDYSCVVSTGATCSTESSLFGTKVYALQCYTGGTTTYNFTRVGTSKVGTVEVTLSASTQYEFKIYAGASQYYGNNTSAVYSDISNYEFKGEENNFHMEAGLGGTFTFTIDYTDNGGAPKVSVTYPRKTIYLTPGVWDAAGAKFAIYYFISDDVKGWTDFMTANDCGMSAEIPLWNGVKMIAARINGSLDAPAFGDNKCYNQTSDIIVEASKNHISITGWNTSDYTTYAPPTYTITFAGNGNTGGSMSNVTDIPCGDNRTLVANGFTKTGHSFTNWIANADVKINGETVTAGSSISNEATIQDITQNITLTAQWAPKTTSVTIDANTAYHGATGSSVTATWGTDLPVFDAATGESGYALTGYFTDPTGGTKIINADGTLAANTTYTTADSKWNSELSALTLYPQYESSISPKTVPCSLNFYYTEVGGAQGKDILDSDFIYSCNKDNAKNDQHNPYQEVCFSGSGHTLTSRMNVVFPQTGTYIFTFPLYIKESGNYDAPRVTVNGQQSAAATISTTGEENRNYETTLNVTAGTYTVSVWIGNTNEKVFFSTMDIAPESVSDEFTISELPWTGSQDLTGNTVVSASAISCFDTELTFTFTGDGTVQYYDNTNRSSSLGTVSSGTAITLTDDLRAHGIYIRCTEGEATLTAVSKTTIGSVYEIWSAEGSTFGAVEVGDWSQQVVLGPEHFQTAKVGDVLRVYTSDEAGGAQGALQYIYTNGDSHTYKGLDNSDSGGLRDWYLSSDEMNRHYFEITINATHLANLQRHGVIVKGSNYTIQSVELRASCSNQTMRTTAPDVTTYGENESIDIMTGKLEFDGEGFDLGNWEHKVELHKNCFTSVTVGSIINFYMKVEEGATLSFRCNVDSVHAESYQNDPPRCPSYGDISFDRTIHNLYGDEPQLIGRIEGYKVLYLLVDADMLSRLQETGMILCGKGTLIKVVEGVSETVVVNSNEEKHVPTVVNNLTIYQGGEVTNNEDIEVLGKITYIRPAHDNGTDGKLGNKLDTWYTFALPFEVSDVEVYDETDKAWFDINAVYYLDDDTNQDANNPDGPGHYYLQYLSKQDIATDREAFITRWQYITPGHSLACVSQYENNNGTRYGYPKKDEAYIILFDSERPIGNYFETSTEVRFVGVGPQTIDGVAKQWKVESDGYEYWMYANNTLHSFTYPGDVYILNEEGTYFILQSNPTIRPFECYVQATASLKAKYAKLPMRGFNIEDNTPTGAESIQGSAIRAEKILRNGQLIIIRNGVEYDATGVVIR